MPDSLEIPELHVEGRDDLYTITELLQRHDIDMTMGKRPVEIVPAGTVEQLVRKMPEAIRFATTRPVGFVLDIDLTIKRRWEQVRGRLRDARVNAPRKCPAEGFIGKREGYPNRVGVWLMPDCTMDGGKLEHFLEALIPKDDQTWAFAQESTSEARRHGAAFSAGAMQKASVHCWLAWQKEPGLPFGTAINAKYFGHDSPQARAFLGWLGRLYDLPQLGTT